MYAGCADDDAGRRQQRRRVGSVRCDLVLARHAEVENLGLLLRRNDDVLRLDVAVDDVAPMRGQQRVGHVGGDRNREADVEGATPEGLGKRFPFDVLHDDRSPSVGFDDHLVDGADVRMLERGGGPRLPDQPVPCRGVSGLVGRNELDGDVSIEGQVARQVDRSHPPGTEEAI